MPALRQKLPYSVMPARALDRSAAAAVGRANAAADMWLYRSRRGHLCSRVHR